MSKKQIIVMIDAGHGGKDPGAVRDGIKEADINRNLAELLRDELHRLGHCGVFSSLTVVQPTEYYPPWQRAGFANSLNPACFISLHTNAFRKPEPSGIRFYVADVPAKRGLDAESRLGHTLGAAIATQAGQALAGIMPVDKLLRPKRFTVLMKTAMPAVLTETGFISNPHDRELLTNSAFLQKTARAYALGIDFWAQTLGRVKNG